MWWLTFRNGFTVAPVGGARVPARASLPMHFFVTLSVMLLATGLGTMVTSSDSTVSTGGLWLACAGLSGYFVVTAVVRMIASVSTVWLVTCGLPCLLWTVAVGCFGSQLSGWVLAALLSVPVAWRAAYGRVSTESAALMRRRRATERSRSVTRAPR